jgi:DNA-binding transcriptional regulator GbsR (MarR family)
MVGGSLRQARDEERVAHFVEQSAAVLEGVGFPRMSARVLMLLMATEAPGLTAAELASALRVSPAAISTALRMLNQLALVERVPTRGERRDRYRLPDDAWYLASTAKQTFYRRIADAAAAGVDATGGPHTASGARLAEMQDFFEYCDREVPSLVERWHNARRNQTTLPRR